jgi:FkbH-like protein
MGIQDYFLYPQINWNAKSTSIRAIAKSLNLGLDTFAFVDDQQFERDEVQFELGSVLCVDAIDIENILDNPAMKPPFVTQESRLRRQMYASEAQRQHAEEEFTGAGDEFLEQLGMSMKIKRAEREDLQRAEELTVRTNQLNTTGYTYSYEELDEFRQSPDHLLLVASLNDKYGPYGSIGLSLVEKGPAFWTIKLLLMSCRVMSRGVGTIMMHYIMSKAKEANARLRAEFISNDRNRIMLVTYRFAGFSRADQVGNVTILENDLSQPIAPFPRHVKLEIVD